jgi:hypothetical protein
MNFAYAGARRILTIAAVILLVQTTWARPVLVAPQRLSVPNLLEPQYPGQYPTSYGTPSIDGDTLIVPASRVANDNYDRRDDVHLFQRDAAGHWNYVRALVEGASGEVRLNGNLATVQTYTALLIFERGAQGWALTDSLETETSEWHSLDRVFRIDEGALYVERNDWVFPPRECQPPYQQWRKVNGMWTAVASIGGERCGDDNADINDGRALVVKRPDRSTDLQGPVDIHAQNGTSSWPRVAQLPGLPADPRGYVNWYGHSSSLSGTSAYIDTGFLFRNTGGNHWVSAGKLVEPETELQISSNQGRLRGNTLVLLGSEPDYELRSLDWELSHEYHTLRAYRKRADGYFDYYAKLSADFDIWFWSLSEDGRTVAAAGPDNINSYDPVNLLYVFEIPDAVSFNGTQQDTFEANNFSRWTTTGGQFAVATNGATRVLRQSSLTGDAGAYLTAIDWTDQSIEADLRPLEFAGNDRWFGLVTRRTDARNYYYVTFRAPSTISLRRMRDGVVTELAWGTLRGGFTPGRNYRVRLESVGDQHVVFVDGIPRVRAKDTTLARGSPGVAGYRTRFEIDNVIVSNATRLVVRFDTWERSWAEGWYWMTPATWQLAPEPGGDVDGDGENNIYVLKQTDSTGDVRWFSKIAAGNQVVSARVRPVSYGATTGAQDPWVGVAAQVKDESNYYYVTLRRSNQLSLRRMVNGTVQVLATVPQPVTTGAWHDLRLEIVGTNIRVFVNGDLKIQIADSTLSGGGRNAMLMYKTAADWESYIVHQP